MRLTVLASGSGGNSILVEAERTRILVDAGPSARELDRRLGRAWSTATLEDIQAVCVTHEHSDHASGVAALAKGGMAVYATEGTARALNLPGAERVVAGSAVAIGALQVTSVAMPHDAAEPVGFVVSDGASRVGVITDCGHASADVARGFADCDVLVLEANHDTAMLRAGMYPPSLKRRIGGTRGHLSNEQAADLLKQIVRASRRPPGAVILAHLSAMNNRPRLARVAIERVLSSTGAKSRLVVAAQERPTPPVTLDARGVVAMQPPEEERQLRLSFPD